ncbi:MAG: PQQ-binding-like beta-propeller repeat protein, partial [Ginsengibacter sp.]
MKRISLYFLFACLWMSCKDSPPTVWNEFHGNSGNTGFTNFASQIANKLKWQFPVGDVAFSSPVVDNDGIIYAGNFTGDLFAIKPDGSQKWKQHLVGRLSSPAIGASGNVYVTNIQKITETNHSSSLFSLDKDGHSLKNWWFAFPDHGYTTAPPKTFSNGNDEFIFVPVHTDNGPELFTFLNQEGAVLMSRNKANCIPNEIVNEGIKNPFEFHIEGIQFDPSLTNEDPPVAISTKGDGGERSPVIVYAAKNCHLIGFTLDPVQHTMAQIWVSPYDYSFYPAPAITTGGVIVLGHGDKTLSAYNLMDGKKIWDYEVQSPLSDYDGFYDCPAILLGTSPSYNLFRNRIIAVDDKGNQVHNFGTTQS